MVGFFDIEKDKIKKLNDGQARELVARLAKAECRAKGLPESGITWGGDQRATDGGVDVRVKIPMLSNTLDFVPKPSTAFQVKAENFPPAKIAKEVAPNGLGRDIYANLASEGGAYVIVSSRDDCSDSALEKRVTKIEETLSALGFTKSIKADFYCTRRLADWASKYPAVATWIRTVVGEPLKGWKPYGAWAYNETDVNAEYLVDSKVRVFTPDDDIGKTLEEAIAELRHSLSLPSVTRLIGLSGVGKTRLIQALFDKRVFPSHLIPSSDNTIYCDISDSPEPTPGAIVESLAESGSDTVVVIDNCSPSEHDRLSNLARRPGSNLKLITVEYDIRDDLPEGTAVYRLDGASDETIKSLLSKNYPILSSADATRIAEYSDGNARVAYALASTAQNTGDFARLRNEELFARLFHQKNPQDDGLMRSAEVASLVYSFEGEDTAVAGELSALCRLAEVSVSTYLRHMHELRRRGLLQSRGVWRAILPHAIANRLAARALESLPRDEVTTALFSGAPDRLANSFARRMGLLHKSAYAVAIARELLSAGGYLSDVAAHDDIKAQMFVNLAPLAPDLVLQQIAQAVNVSGFFDGHADRSKYAKLLKLIAYDATYFVNSSNVLKVFASKNKDDFQSKSFRDAYSSLFQVAYSGTHAPLVDRVRQFQRLAASPDREDNDLSFDVLSAALSVSDFLPNDWSDFGSHSRDYGWRPRTASEFVEWYETWLNLCVDLASPSKPQRDRIRSLVSDSLRELWHGSTIRPLLDKVVRQMAPTGDWPDAWCSIKTIIGWDSSNLSKIDTLAIKNLEVFLRPKNLVDEAKAKIFSHGSSFLNDRDGEDFSKFHRKLIEEAEKLGENIARDPSSLREILPLLVQQSHGSNTYSFGKGVGRTVENVPEVLQELRTLLANGDNADVSLIPLRGVIAGWNERDPDAVDGFLNQALNDKIWSQWFVELQVQTAMDDRAFARLLDALENKRSPLWQFRYLSFGRSTDAFTVAQLKIILDKIVSQGSDGLSIAIDLLGMIIHCAIEKDEDYREELRQASSLFLLNMDWSTVRVNHTMTDHYIDNALDFVLNGQVSENEASALLESILRPGRRPGRSYRSNDSKIMMLFFARFPRLTLDAVYQPDADGRFRNAYNLVKDNFSDRKETAIAAVPTDDLINWCNASPAGRYPFAAATCRLFTGNEDDSATEISAAAKSVLNHAPDKLAVAREILSRLRPRSWSGSLSLILEQRLPLLQSLDDNSDPSISIAIAEEMATLRLWIDRERQREAEDERTEALTFE